MLRAKHGVLLVLAKLRVTASRTKICLLSFELEIENVMRIITDEWIVSKILKSSKLDHKIPCDEVNSSHSIYSKNTKSRAIFLCN